MKLAHIGIAVKSLNESVPVFEKIFNVTASEMEFVEEQKVNVRKFHLENCDIELLEGTDMDSPITKFIDKKGEGIHHVSFEVNGIQQKLDMLKDNGIDLINETPVIGADEMLVAFLHPKSTNKVLMELTERNKRLTILVLHEKCPNPMKEENIENPDTQSNRSSLEDKLKNIPVSPGVYQFKDSAGKIIYIGKAKILRNRVRQYFQSKPVTGILRIMISKIADVELITTDNEIEALILEQNLIKIAEAALQHQFKR